MICNSVCLLVLASQVDPDFMPFSKAKAAQLRGADGLVPTLEARGFQCR